MLTMHRGSSDWKTGLLSGYHTCDYFNAAFCPCIMLYEIADLMPDGKRDSSSWNLCQTGVISCLLDMPALLCVDQFSTRGLDYLANRPTHADRAAAEIRQREMESGETSLPLVGWLLPPEVDRSIYESITSRYGANHPLPSWENDGVGWDLNGQSEVPLDCA